MNSTPMSPDELGSRGRALFGDRWLTALAHELSVGDRTIRRWLAGEIPIPEGVDFELRQILEQRLKTIGGLIGYSVNLADRSIFHYPTNAAFVIEEGDALNLVFGKMIPIDQRELVIAGAQAALRQERERDPRVVGRFWR